MKAKEHPINKRRLNSSYVTSIISISLVLFLLGVLGLLVLYTKKVSDYVKENIGFSVILNENVREVEILRLQKTLDAARYVKSTEYITKERAAKELQEELGEDFVEFLGHNPLLASIDVKLHAPYANPDSVVFIETELLNYQSVKEVFYHKSLIHLVNENIRKISLIILVFSGLLTLIAIALINNTIRLSVYSKRFIINTMNLVGATRGFIRKPFLFKSALHGIYAALGAFVLIAVIIYYVQQEFKEIVSLHDYEIMGTLLLLLLMLGATINWVSTYFAVNKYLNIKTDDLYI